MTNIIIIVGFFLFLLLLGTPVVFSLGGATMVWLLFLRPDMPITTMSQNMMNQMLSFALIAMPGFMLVGQLMSTCGVTDKLFKFSVAMVGRFRGGLAQANALASMLFASMSGNAVADVGGLGLVEMDMMNKAGYERPFSASITAASSILGPIIPPSTIMILIAAISSISLTSLFYAGIVPGILLTAALIVQVGVRAKLTKRGRQWPKNKVPWRQALKTIPAAIPALMTFIIIIGSIYSGICTPTEAAVLAVWWSILLGVIYKKLTWKNLWATLKRTAYTAGIFMLIMSTASFFSWIITVEGLPQAMSSMLGTLSGHSEYLMWLVCIVIFLVMGCFLDTGAAVLLLAPIMVPAATANGIDAVLFAIIMIVALMIGIITPPYGLCLFVVSDVGKVPVKSVTREAVKFIPAMLITLALLVIFPKLVVWLPNLLG